MAKELGIVYVDTGAIYRSIGYYIYKNGMDPKDAAAVVAVLPQIRVDMRYSDDGLQHMLLNGEDVTEQIRLPEISMYASAVSAIPEVRTFYWKCSGIWPGAAASLWMAGISAPWCCLRPR